MSLGVLLARLPPGPSGIPRLQVWRERVHFFPLRDQVMEMISIGNACACL